MPVWTKIIADVQSRVALMEEGNAHESYVEDPLVDAAEKVDHDLKARNVLRTTFLVDLLKY